MSSGKVCEIVKEIKVIVVIIIVIIIVVVMNMNTSHLIGLYTK